MISSLAVSFVGFTAGVYLLHRMFVLEQRSGVRRFPMVFAYFFSQHLAFGLGGLLLVLVDPEATYSTRQGVFAYADGVFWLQIANGLALAAGYLGLICVEKTVRLTLSISRTPLGPTSRDASTAHPFGSEKLLWAICLFALGAHAVVVGLQFAWVFLPVEHGQRYVADAVASQSVGTVFLFWGAWLARSRRGRGVFLAYAVGYAVLTLAWQGRAFAIFLICLYLIGYQMNSLGDNSRKRPIAYWLSPKRMLLGMVAASLLLWFFAASDAVKLIYHGRAPETPMDMVGRVGTLLTAPRMELEGNTLDILRALLLVFSQRICDVTAVDLVARTPDWVPYAGFPKGMWRMIWRGLLPGFLFPGSDLDVVEGPLVLAEYGWNVTYEAAGGLPVTLIGDSWRRFGVLGILGVHFFLGVLLGGVSFVLARGGRTVAKVLFGGAIVSVLIGLYTASLLPLIASLPRRAVIWGVYALVGSRVVAAMLAARGVAAPPRSAFVLRVRAKP